MEPTTFNKKQGAAGMEGQLYEIYLTLYFLLENFKRHENGQNNRFYIAANMDEAQSFDDVVVKYNSKTGLIQKSNIIFLQAKHKEKPENAKEQITLDKLLSETKNPFSLKDYFHSFRKVKMQYSERNMLHPIFGGPFDDCEFVILTNARPHRNFNTADTNLKIETIDKDHILKFDEINYFYKLVLTGNRRQNIIDVLKYSSDCALLAKQLVQSIFPDDKRKQAEIINKDLIKKYHVPLAENIIEKIQNGLGRFKKSFLDHDNLSKDKKLFQVTFFEELLKKEAFSKKSINVIKSELQQLNFKLPINFGIPDQYSETCLPNDLVNEEEILEFLNKLKLCINYPNVAKLNEILMIKIRENYFIEENEIHDIFSIISKKVENWWGTSNEFLTEKNKNDYLNLMKISLQFDVDAPVLNFTGRETELINLHLNLQTTVTKNVTIISQMATICGLGGIGKTELARQYINRYSQYYDQNIIWLNAENEVVLIESLKRLCKDKLKISTKDANDQPKDIKSIVQEVYKFFSKRKSIFIFDNAEKGKYIYMFLRLHSAIINSNKPFVIITSRDKEWDFEMKVIELHELKIEEAINLVKKGLKLNGNLQNDSVQRLVTKLQCYPLALQQAISYISYQNVAREYRISDYLNKFASYTKYLLSSNEFRGIFNKYTETTFTTWNITKQKIKCDQNHGKIALEILNIISYFSSENINRNIFSMLVENNTEILENSVRLLVRLSLVNGEDRQIILNVHRLVQDVTRIELKMENKEETILKKGLELLENVINEPYLNLDHLISTWNYAKKYENLLKQFKHLPSTLINKLNQASRFKEAIEFGKDALKLLVNELGPDDVDSLRIETDLGESYLRQGNYFDALQLFTEVYQRLLPILGNKHPATLKAKSSIAEVLCSQGKYDDALVLLKDVYEKQKLIGETHQQTNTIKHNIAFIYQKQGKYEESLKFYNEISKELKEVNKIDILSVKFNKAVVLDQQGKYEEALTIYEEIYENRKDLLGEMHHSTLKAKLSIELIYVRQGKNRGQNICEIYEKLKEILVENHPDILATKHNIAFVYEEHGKYEDALKLLKEVYESKKKILGELHPETLITKHNIAALYHSQAKFEDSLKVFKEIYEDQKEILGESHPATLHTRKNMAIVYEDLGKSDVAINILNETYETQKQMLGEEHPDTLKTKQILRTKYKM